MLEKIEEFLRREGETIDISPIWNITAKPRLRFQSPISSRACGFFNARLEKISLKKSASSTEILRKDPIGAYSEMDFATRDCYRHHIERMAQEDKS